MAHGAGLALLVAVQSQMLVGGFDADRRWVKASDAGKLAQGGEAVELFNLKGALGKGKLKKAKPGDEAIGPVPEWTVGVEWTGKAAAAEGVFAAASAKAIIPRPIEVLSTKSEIYRKVVRDWLTTHGLQKPEVHLTGVVRVDLDGDGTQEVILSANPGAGYLNAGRVDHVQAQKAYCLVLVRKIVKGVVKTIEVHAQVATKKEPVFRNVELMAVGDLDGDGKMELITSYDYYEGIGNCVFRIDGATSDLLGCEGFGA